MTVARRRTLIASAASLCAARRAAAGAGSADPHPDSCRPPRVARTGVRAGLRGTGYVPVLNVDVEMRFADSEPSGSPCSPTGSSASASTCSSRDRRSARRAAKARPRRPRSLFSGSSDPVAGGLVTNLARPAATSLACRSRHDDGVTRVVRAARRGRSGATHYALIWSPTNAAATMFVREIRRRASARVAPRGHEAPDLRSARPRSMRSRRAARRRHHRGKARSRRRSDRARRVRRGEAPPGHVLRGGLRRRWRTDVVRAELRGRVPARNLYVDRILKRRAAGDLAVEQPTAFDWS